MNQSVLNIVALGTALAAACSMHGQAPERSSQPRLAPGTTLPVTILATIRADRAQSGNAVLARTTQTVALADGALLPKSTSVRGHIVRSEYHRRSNDAFATQERSVLELIFDTVEVGGHSLPIHLVVRAIASPTAVQEARRPYGDSDLDPTRTVVQVGGDRLTPSQLVVEDAQGRAVGHQRNFDASARLIASEHCDFTSREVSVGIFSASACGAYGYSDTTIDGIGLSSRHGAVVLSSSKQAATLARNTAVLLEVVSTDAPERTANR